MRNVLLTLLTVMLISSCLFGYGQKTKKNRKKGEIKQEKVVSTPAQSPYVKLFAKKHEKKDGLMPIHLLDNKIYLEIPENLLNKDLAIASTVVKTSENGHSIVGEKPHPLMHIRFEKMDSSISMTDASYMIQYKKGHNVAKAATETRVNPILQVFKVVAKSPDGKYVIDATSLFIEHRVELDPFAYGSYSTGGGMIERSVAYKKDRSFISGIKAFENNVLVESTLSYEYSLKFMGMPLAFNEPYTAVMSRSIFLLPEVPMDIRIADPRIGYFTTGKLLYQDDKGTSPYRLVNRWRLEPKDEAAYLKGELVEPKKKIVFYMDNKFPEAWKPYIKEGIEFWNMAFERAGFKNAVEVREFPVNDPDFHIGNMEYSCVNYAPSPNANAMGPSWVDPRTGEIINASVYMYHDIVKVLYDWRFLQTAQLDPEVRKDKFSDELMGDCIRYVSAHEVGHCLGLMHNMSASAAFPVDSLRSASFTQKYGTTPSIMDYARYNYIAQPEDSGVKLTPPNMGEYDKYAIEWGYRYFGNADAERDAKVLAQMIFEKNGNPIYRYGKQQIYSQYDPTAQTEDLGDDPIKAATYGIKNLKYILANMNEWFAPFDKDYSCVLARYKSLQGQYMGHISRGMNVIGGICLNEKFRGDKLEAHVVVPREQQKAATAFVMNELKNMGWIENRDILKNADMAVPYVSNLSPMILQAMCGKAVDVAFSEYMSDEKKPYSAQEYYNDLVAYVFDNTHKGKSLSKIERELQESFVLFLAKPLGDDVKSFNTGLSAYVEEQLELLTTHEEKMEYLRSLTSAWETGLFAGFNFQRKINPAGLRKLEAVQYGVLNDVYQIILQKKNTGDAATRVHYNYLLKKLTLALGKN